MAKKVYNLQGEAGKLEVSWNLWMTKYGFSLNGQSLGEFSVRELKDGKELSLPDGSVLKLKLAQVLTNYELQIFRNGQPVVGTAADPQTQIKSAYVISYFVGGITAALGLLALLMPSLQLMNPKTATGAIVEGAVFLALGYFISKKYAWAALAAVILLTVDTILYFVQSGQAGSTYLIGAIFAKILFIIYMFKGYRAAKKLKADNKAV